MQRMRRMGCIPARSHATLLHVMDTISITANGRSHVLPAEGMSLASFIARMGLEGKRIAVERNGEIVPRSRYAVTALADGDKLEIVGAVGGG